MPSEKQIDDYINGLEEKNQIYVEEELKYADKCHKLEDDLGCPLDVIGKLRHGFYHKDYGFIKESCINTIDFDILLNRIYVEFIIIDYDSFDNCDGESVVLYPKDYKSIFWLREDKSE